MKRSIRHDSALCQGHALTRHASQRMQQRALSPDILREVLAFGREVRVRGAIIYALGRKEVESLRRDGVDVSDAKDVHVVCSEDGVVLTAYRNPDFRSLRQGRPRSRRTSW